ncbi:MAG: endonuclease III domain-containing protein [Nitrospinae bacterium]|nr:endonuclease III domain-containing protein [Nitrospinota bacterium]MBI3813497.1 endonuclease III domain-containing protein [Nitrospinota bacterium]
MKKKLVGIYKTLYSHFGPQDWWPGDTPFEVCVGAILTQNTAWQNVEKAIANLKREKLLAPHRINELTGQSLARLIKPSGYFNIKAKRLKNFISFLCKRYDGKVDKMFSNSSDHLRGHLLDINGIGPETADSILLYAGNIPIFVVDAYTKRIFHKLKFTPEDISYHDMQQLFMKNLPLNAMLFNEYHALIVMLGKNYCKKRPLCESCPLKMCNYRDK